MLFSIKNSEPEEQSNSSTSNDSSMHHEPYDKKLKSNAKGKNIGIKVFFYRWCDASHKVSECTFEKNSIRTDNGKEHIWYLDSYN
uniref:Uncharacterized protein n=1 Tax=Lactuca sativa TaxID=4236 RepID=A0A9R1VYP1_LACSA|nr:hypothetical protein LSAT_V11C400180630 [Lactuca sativa]